MEKIKRPESYIGISGVINPEQQTELEGFADSLGFSSLRRRLMLGVKATHKTQFMDIENKYGADWYPVGENIKDTITPRTENNNSLYIAQAYFDIDLVGDQQYRDDFSRKIFERGATWIDGIQFDMLPWHTHPAMIQFLESLKQQYDAKIFLQCHKNAMDELGPDGVVEKLKDYAHTIDYALFDSSHGTGTKLDVDKLQSFIEPAYASTDLQSIGLAIAGGLNGDIVRSELPAILSNYPDLSWDAEGQLHPATPSGARPLNMKVVQEYLANSADVIEKL